MRKMLLIGAVMLMAASAQAAVVVASPVVMARPVTVTPVRPATPPPATRPQTTASKPTPKRSPVVKEKAPPENFVPLSHPLVVAPPYIFHHGCSKERRKRKECS